ncbi:hypothetical protein [uncultured Rubinisphaera sp.]|uniref:hypothetical protein n=1 Tax=uncultured Rubinisphaera sp. TaxID=1678686 RepID=UPI0030DDDB66
MLRAKYEASLHELQSSIEQIEGCREQLHTIMSESFAYCSADVRVPRFMFQTAYGPNFPGVTEHLERLGSERFNLIKSVIDLGISCGELAKNSVKGLTLVICCLMDQYINVLTRLENQSSQLAPELAAWLIELFSKG